MPQFIFSTSEAYIEAATLEEALGQYALRLWFPGIVFAQQVDRMHQPIGDKINLRVQTSEGLAFDVAVEKRKEANYGQLLLRELIRKCQASGIKIFKYREYKTGGPDATIILNKKGQELQKASIEAIETKQDK